MSDADGIVVEEPVKRPDTAVEVIRAARAYLDEHGWRQYGYTDGAGRCCVKGALQLVSTSHAEPVLGTHALYGALAAVRATVREDGYRVGSEKDAIVVFNDSLGRTKEQVLDLLDRTVRRMEGRSA